MQVIEFAEAVPGSTLLGFVVPLFGTGTRAAIGSTISVFGWRISRGEDSLALYPFTLLPSALFFLPLLVERSETIKLFLRLFTYFVARQSKSYAEHTQSSRLSRPEFGTGITLEAVPGSTILGIVVPRIGTGTRATIGTTISVFGWRFSRGEHSLPSELAKGILSGVH
jgi:hypothetical protein